MELLHLGLAALSSVGIFFCLTYTLLVLRMENEYRFRDALYVFVVTALSAGLTGTIEYLRLPSPQLEGLVFGAFVVLVMGLGICLGLWAVSIRFSARPETF